MKPRSQILMAGLAAAGVLICAVGGARAAGPIRLTDNQLDRVTAGINLGLSAAAIATGGNFALSETNGAGATGSTSLPGGGSVQSGAIVGTAAAYSPGGSASASAATSGAVPGGTTVYISTGGTVSFPGGQTSISATFVSGGPTFLP
jgi:hypothetical protein